MKTIYYFIVGNISCFIHSVKNLIRWFPVIWNDGDGDESWMFLILKFKLECMYEALGTWYKDTPDHDKNIRTCILLIDRILAEDYGMWAVSGTFIPFVIHVEKTLAFDKNSFHNYIDYMMKQDLRLLFHLMEKHVCTWWD